MTTNAELRKAVKEMAEQLAQSVVKLVSSMSLRELAALTGSGPIARGELPSLPASRSSKASAKSKPASKSKSAAKPASKPAAKSARKPGRPAKVAVERKLNRRDGAEIEKLRKGVLDALKGSDDWLSAKEIGAKIGRGVGSEELTFPINYLRDRGLVQKKGERSQTRYRITDKGKSHEGGFTGTPSSPPPAAAPDESDPASEG